MCIADIVSDGAWWEKGAALNGRTHTHTHKQRQAQRPSSEGRGRGSGLSVSRWGDGG